jgi:hypothetical protein
MDFPNMEVVMKRRYQLIELLAVCFAAVTTGSRLEAQATPSKAPQAAAQTAQAPAPDIPFRTVHLINIESGKEAEVLAIFEQFNQVMAKLGCADCRYRLWKVSGNQQGPHAYIWDSIWPGRAMYDTIHNASDWKTLSSSQENLQKLLKDHVYNRLVEVSTPKR